MPIKRLERARAALPADYRFGDAAGSPAPRWRHPSANAAERLGADRTVTRIVLPERFLASPRFAHECITDFGYHDIKPDGQCYGCMMTAEEIEKQRSGRKALKPLPEGRPIRHNQPVPRCPAGDCGSQAYRLDLDGSPWCLHCGCNFITGRKP